MSAKKKIQPKPKPPVERDPIPVFTEEPGAAERPDTYVIGDDFYAVTSDGMLRVQMRFKTSLFKQVLRHDGDEIEGFLILLDGLGDAATVAQLDELDIFETARIAADYFQAWREKQQASMGEAGRSSN
jgi:hypothetical protein